MRRGYLRYRGDLTCKPDRTLRAYRAYAAFDHRENTATRCRYDDLPAVAVINRAAPPCDTNTMATLPAVAAILLLDCAAT